MSTDSVHKSLASVPDVLFSRSKNRTLTVLAFIIAILGSLVVLFHVFTAAFPPLDPYIQRHFVLSVGMVLGFLMFPLSRKSWSARLDRWFIVDLALIAVTLLPLFHVLSDMNRFIRGGVPNLTPLEIALGTMFMIAVLELTRRVVGWMLSAVAVFFVLQNVFAAYMPQPFYGPPMAWGNLVQTIWSGTDGIFGLVASIVTSFLIIFFLFAALLKSSGAGTVLFNLALSLVGKYSGAPAKVAVVASTLFGTISGSPIANVVATGSVTIPMMKKMGFSPTMAGAVEAVASTGGQIVPPVMGVTAFIIPQFLGISYLRVMLAALIPAFLYYLAVFLQVHFTGKKLGIEGLPADQLPKLKEALISSWVIFVPISVLVYFLIMGYSLGRVALYATIVMLITGVISRKEPRLTPRSIFNAFSETVSMIIPVVALAGTVGIIIATFYNSGVGDRFGTMIANLSVGSMWPAVLLTGLLCIILGMGVPTPIIYITMVLTTIPVMVNLGVNPLAAHMFAFILGVSSGLTPPVCPTAFVAAAMAGAPMMRTGWLSFRLGLVAFVLPFLFVANPAVLLIGSPVAIILTVISYTAGVFALASAVEGYFTGKLNWLTRVMLALAGIACMWPYYVITDILGILATVAILAFSVWKAPKVSKAIPKD